VVAFLIRALLAAATPHFARATLLQPVLILAALAALNYGTKASA
jgi:hypothetical protein